MKSPPYICHRLGAAKRRRLARPTCSTSSICIGKVAMGGGQTDMAIQLHKEHHVRNAVGDIPPLSLVVHSPSQAVYHDEGLFLQIASFCDHRTTIRFCTITKTYCGDRSRLTGRMLYCPAAATKCSTVTEPKSGPVSCSKELSGTYTHRDKSKVAAAATCTCTTVDNDENNANNTTCNKVESEDTSTEPTADQFLDGQDLIDALMLRVAFDLRWIPPPSYPPLFMHERECTYM